MQLYDYEKKHLSQLREGLAECCVLLKRDGTFPLEKPGKIAAYGSGVRKTVKGGTGSGEVNSRYFTTVEEGLVEAGFDISTKSWLDSYDAIRVEAYKAFKNEIKARAKANHTNMVIEGMGAVMPEPEYELALDGEGDVAIYVLSRISGEGSDRKAKKGDVFLSNTEMRDILALNAKYEKFMLVLNVGGAVDLTPVKDVKNILILSQLGVETGAALADILLGKSCPSGKLATTWSAWEDYCTIGEFGEKDDTRYTEGIYVGYRYFDSVGKKAMYPFGFGLGYTDFQIADAKVKADGEQITVKATVKNTGNYPGKEVVQVYVSAPQGELDKPYQTLAGFGKTPRMNAGEEKQIVVSFKLSELASYDTSKAAWILEKGDYIVRVGNSSVDTNVCGVLSLNETVVTCQLENKCGGVELKDWKPESMPVKVDLSGVPVIFIDAVVFTKEEPSYEIEHSICEEVKALSDEELAYMNIGNIGKGMLSIIGNAASHLAGAAGETTARLKEKGIPVMVMADGPAGIRISQRYYRDKKGIHSLDCGVPKNILELLPAPIRWFQTRERRVKKGVEVKEQYTTAIPIGTAVAQSWNVDFAKMCGDIVGDEMERFDVHLWLAPALNIHRSILCGRNFEYFSEDPLISGRFAAAITDGVQAHKGCGVTIKHFAANNQELCRYSNNSMISQRALREIYLKGFEICVKESQPHALMTSYNLLNGVHTSDCRELTEDILRCEWGFQGIVMTDWVVRGDFLSKPAKYPVPHTGKVAAAGGDLLMPGAPYDYKELMASLKDGTVTREQLEINASRVYRMIQKLVMKKEVDK